MFNEQRKRPEEFAPMKEILTSLLDDIIAFQKQMADTSEYTKTLVVEFTELQKRLQYTETEEDRQKLVELQTKLYEARGRFTEAERAIENIRGLWGTMTILGTPPLIQA